MTYSDCSSLFRQVGRSSESPIDFVVMDTLPGDKKDAKVMQSTISRFACRILVNRCEPAKARIFAAGFDSSRNIFLGVSVVGLSLPPASDSNELLRT